MKLKKDLIVREEGQEGFIYNEATEAISILNYTGMIAIRLLAKDVPFEEIVANIQQAYNGKEKKDIELDLNKFLDDLRKRNFLNE